MALVLADRVQVTATANTTVSFTLSSASTGYQTFAAVGNGNTTYYGATDGTNWEVGIGTYTTSGPTLTRTTILSSSNSGSAVTFTGSVTVWVDYPAENAVYASNNPGTSGYVLTSQGSGVAPIWATGSGGGGISWQSVQTADFTATTGNAYPVDTTSAAITVTLPASPSVGDVVTVLDYAGTSATNNIIVNPNGNKLQGTTFNALISVNRQAYNFVYVDATQGWLSYAQEYNALTQSAPPSGDPYWTDVSLLTNSANELSFADASTNNFPITNNGGVAPSLNTPVTGGGSQYFNGSSALEGTTALITPSTTTCTFETFAYLTANPSGSSVISGMVTLNGNTSPGANYISFGPCSDNKVKVRWYSGSVNVCSGTTTLSLNTWYHIALVINSGAISFYINGVAETLSGTTTFATIAGTSNVFALGYNSDAVFNGYLSNARYNTNALYTSNFTPSTTPLTAVSGTSLLINGTNQNTFDNATFYDQSANSFAISQSGSPVYSGLSPFGNAYPGSVYLDGSSNLGVANSSSLDVTGSFTLECWVYRSSSSNGAFFSKGGGSASWSTSNGHEYLLFIDSGTLYFQWNASGSPTAISTTAPASGAWHNITIGYNGTTTRMWVDGVSAGTSSTGYTLPTTRNIVRVGALPDNSYLLTGFISNLRWVSGTDVYGVSNSTITVPSTPLPATTDTSLLLGCDTGAFYDLSNTGNPISQSGSPVVTTQVSPFSSVTESYYLDGSSYNLLPSNSGYNFGTGDFTIEAWVYGVGLTTSSQALCSLGNGGVFFGVKTNGIHLAQSYVADLADFSATINNGSWYHLAMTNSGGTIRAFVNGVQAGSNYSNSSNFTASNNSAIGAQQDGAVPLNGYINNLRITKGVARYTATFTPPTAPFPTSA